MLHTNRFEKFSSRLVKLLMERIYNIQSRNEYLFQIRNSKIPKKNNSVISRSRHSSYPTLSDAFFVEEILNFPADHFMFNVSLRPTIQSPLMSGLGQNFDKKKGKRRGEVELRDGLKYCGLKKISVFTLRRL